MARCPAQEKRQPDTGQLQPLQEAGRNWGILLRKLPAVLGSPPLAEGTCQQPVAEWLGCRMCSSAKHPACFMFMLSDGTCMHGACIYIKRQGLIDRKNVNWFDWKSAENNTGQQGSEVRICQFCSFLTHAIFCPSARMSCT